MNCYVLGSGPSSPCKIVYHGLAGFDQLIVYDDPRRIINQTYARELLSFFGHALLHIKDTCWRCRHRMLTISQSIAYIRGLSLLAGDSKESSTFATFVSTHPGGFSNVSDMYDGIGYPFSIICSVVRRYRIGDFS